MARKKKLLNRVERQENTGVRSPRANNRPLLTPNPPAELDSAPLPPERAVFGNCPSFAEDNSLSVRQRSSQKWPFDETGRTPTRQPTSVGRFGLANSSRNQSLALGLHAGNSNETP